MKYFCFYIVLTALIASCAKEQKIYTRPLGPQKIYDCDLGTLFKKVNSYFGVHFFSYGDTNYVLCLREDTLKLLNLQNLNSVSSIDFSKYKNCFNDNSSVYLTNNKLYILNIDNKVISRFELSDKQVTLKMTYKIDHLLDWNKYYLYQAYNSPVVANDSLMFLPYETYDRKNNYLDKQSCVLAVINDSAIRSKPEFVLHFPKTFRKSFFYDTNTFLRILDDSTMFYGFVSTDSIYKYNFLRKIYTQKVRMEKTSFFRKLNNRKARDIGYLRWYEFTTEKNENVVVLDKSILVIKRQRRNELTDSVKREYYILDKDYKLKWKGIFKHRVSRACCFPFLKGFIVFEPEFKKAYYYETD